MIPRNSTLRRAVVQLGDWACWLFLVAIVLAGYEVVMRYAFGAPSTWVHDTTATLCVIAFALGGAYCMVDGEHIRITFVLDKTSGLTRKLLEGLALVAGVFYLAGFAYAMVSVAEEALWRFDYTGRWTPELMPGPPEWPLPSINKLAITFGTLLFLVVTAVMLAHFAARRGELADSPESASS